MFIETPLAITALGSYNVIESQAGVNFGYRIMSQCGINVNIFFKEMSSPQFTTNPIKTMIAIF
jgi:hypothetical protein